MRRLWRRADLRPSELFAMALGVGLLGFVVWALVRFVQVLG